MRIPADVLNSQHSTQRILTNLKIILSRRSLLPRLNPLIPVWSIIVKAVRSLFWSPTTVIASRIRYGEHLSGSSDPGRKECGKVIPGLATLSSQIFAGINNHAQGNQSLSDSGLIPLASLRMMMVFYGL